MHCFCSCIYVLNHIMAQPLDCSECKTCFAELDVPIRYNSCLLPVHSRCFKHSVMVIKCLGMKNGSLKYFYDACDQGLKGLAELKDLIRKLLIEEESF